jgi:hypothetical protein
MQCWSTGAAIPRLAIASVGMPEEVVGRGSCYAFQIALPETMRLSPLLYLRGYLLLAYCAGDATSW